MSKLQEPASKGYGQHCPIAVAAEIMAERWTWLLDEGRLKLDGSRKEVEAIRQWFCLSRFAAEGRRLTAV